MDRRSVSIACGIGLFAAGEFAWGQPGASKRVVGVPSITSASRVGHLIEAFGQGMRDLGWVEGHNIEYRMLFADGDLQQLDALAADLVTQKVDIILAASTVDTRAAQKATTVIPIVMVNASNVVENKFVASLARPGGNITGLANQFDVVVKKLIELLHEAVPLAKRVAILVNETNPSARTFWAAAQSACSAQDLVALRVVAGGPSEFAGAVAQIRREQPQAVLVTPDAMYFKRASLQALLGATGLPVAYAFREHVAAGGLLSYSENFARTLRYAAIYVDKILKGAKPADLPVEQPTTFEFVINLKTAKALGITIPQSVLLRADEVIQ